MTKRNKYLVDKVSEDIPAVIEKNKKVKAKDVFDYKQPKKSPKKKKKKKSIKY